MKRTSWGVVLLLWLVSFFARVSSAQVPSITSLSPNSGITGTAVTITGTNFGSTQGTSTVSFNGVAASPTSWSATSIVAPVPANATTGPVTVKVGTNTSNGVTFSVKPNIAAITPTSGPQSSVVQLTGTGFGTTQGSSTLKFNGIAVAPSSWSNTKLISELPALASTGPFVVTVGGLASNAVTFTVLLNGTISGTVTQTTGAAIASATIKAYLQGVQIASVSTNTSGSYSIVNLAPGTYVLTITKSGFSSQTISAVAVNAGATTTSNFIMTTPAISAISPTSGPTGASVTISGSNFGALKGSNYVSFNSVTATITSWSNTSILAKVPGTATTGPVVAHVGSAASNGVTFTVGTGTFSGTVTAASGGGAISGATVQALQSGTVRATTTTTSTGSYSIASLAPGTYDLMTSASGFGTHISANNSATAGTTTTVNVALSAAGTISGKVTQSNGTTAISGATVRAYQGLDTAGTATTDSSGNYSIATLGAGSYSVDASAAGYNTQTKTGVSVTASNTTTTNFSLATQPVITYVYDEAGRLTSVVNSATNAVVYKYDAAGNILSISNNPSSQVSISEFTPNGGPVGSTVTIYGTGFSSTASQDTVKFNGTTATVTSASPTQIVTKVPTGATTGTISVTAPAGTATSGSAFTVTSSNGLPTISSFSPTIGTPGTAVTVTGTNFDANAGNDSVQFNGGDATISTVASTSIATSVPVVGTSGHISISTRVGTATSAADFFVPPPPFQASDVVLTGRMTLGGTSTVTINTASKIGLMLFDGTAGQRVSLLLNNSTFTGCNAFSGTVIAPGGARLITGNACNSTSLYLEVPGVLPTTGTYTIMVQGFTTGSLTVNSYNVPADVVKSISIGGAAVIVTTTTPGQNAQLTFTGTVGQKVSLFLTGITYTGCNGTTLKASIIGPDGTSIAAGSECNGTTLYVDAQYLPLSGTYTILVDPQGSATGSFTANLYNAADITQSITAGTPTTVTIGSPGQKAKLTFSGTAGQRISLLMSGVTIAGSTVTIQNTTAALTAGQKYSVKMEYFQAGGGSQAQLKWRSTSTPEQIIASTQLYPPGSTTSGGLQGDYFPDSTLEGHPQVTRTDPTVNFTWNGANPDPSISGNNFSARWTGSVQAQFSENYVFCTTTDDGVRLYFNNALVINHWQSQGATEWCSDTLASIGVGTGGQFIDVITLPLTGTYSILVDPQSNNTGNMTLTLYSVPADITNTITPGGAAVTVTTTTPGQNGQLTFSGTAGQRISLLMSGVTIPGSAVTIQNTTAALTAGQKYSLRMDYFQAGGGSAAQLRWFSNSTSKQIIPSTQLYPPGSTTSGGLQGDYFPDSTLEGHPQVTRTDPTVNFSWGGANPDPSISGSNFSARWTGSVQPQFAEAYTFCTNTDDGVRLYFNNALIINQWRNQSAEWCSDTLATAGVGTGGQFIDTLTLPVTGTYTILIDPQNSNTGSMTLTLYSVPADVNNTITPGGSAVTVSTTTPGQNAQLTFTGTTGQRVSLLMDSVTIPSTNVSVLDTAPLIAGQKYSLKMEYFQGTSSSSAQLRFYSPSTVKQIVPQSQLYAPGTSSATGLQGNYFTNINLAGTPTLTRVDPTINFNWTGTSPDPSIPSTNFSVRWLGSVQAALSENYVFCTTTDDGTRLWINNSLEVNDWRSQGATEFCSDTWTTAGVGTGGNFIDTITLPAAGTYVIPVDPLGSGTGNIRFTLYNVPSDVSGSLTINGASSNVGITTPGQNGTLAFSGTAGQLLTVHLTNNTVPGLTVSLLNPDGTTATSLFSGASSFNLTQQTLGTTGTYSVLIDPNGANTGSITVGVTSP